MDFKLYTPRDLQTRLATRFRSLRLARNIKRSSLAEMSGVPASSIRRFERDGEISLRSLIKLTHALGASDQLERLFIPSTDEHFASLKDAVASDSTRKRGRQ